MKAFYSLSQPFDVEQLCLHGCFAIKMLSYRPKFVQQRLTRPSQEYVQIAELTSYTRAFNVKFILVFVLR